MKWRNIHSEPFRLHTSWVLGPHARWRRAWSKHLVMSASCAAMLLISNFFFCFRQSEDKLYFSKEADKNINFKKHKELDVTLGNKLFTKCRQEPCSNPMGLCTLARLETRNTTQHTKACQARTIPTSLEIYDYKT